MQTLKNIQGLNIIRELITRNGTLYNNPLIPLLVYTNACKAGEGELKHMLATHDWTNFWIDSIFSYHHYHSMSHEVLIVLRGSASLQFGGDGGRNLSVSAGDCIIIPAGVAHKCLIADDNFAVLGAYPAAQPYDLVKENELSIDEAEKRIKAVKVPPYDPLYGSDGPLIKNWKA